MAYRSQNKELELELKKDVAEGLMKVKSLLLALLFASPLCGASVGPGHVIGKITDISSVSTGILVRIEAGEVPQNCTSGIAWMHISQEYQAIISLTITAWTLGRGVTVYTSPESTSYCQVWQVDPAEN